MWHPDALNLKPETSHLKPCPAAKGTLSGTARCRAEALG